MRTKYLSRGEREKGTKHYFTWAIFNGLGFNFLGDTIVQLMAIHFGASNTQLGYISSILHVSGLVLLFLPRLLVGMNIIKVQFYAWLMRGLVCCLYGLLLFSEGQTAVIIVLIVYTLFCVFRTFGIVVEGPIRQMLTTSFTRGELVVRISTRFQTVSLLSRLTSFLVLSVKQLAGFSGYFILLIAGIITNTLAALSLKNIPCREVVEYRQGGNIFTVFKRSMKNREQALSLFVKWHTLSLLIIFAFIIPFLRKIANFPPNVIFLYTVSGTLAMTLASYMLRPFADRVGSRPIITIASFLLALMAIIWSVIPPTMPRVVYFLLGFLTFFLLWSVLLLALRLELQSIPEKDKISYVSMLNFVSAVVSLCVGLSAGMLADLGERVSFPGLNPFGLTFFMGAFLAMQNGILCFFLKDPGSLSVKETAAILLSTRNLKTFLDIYQLSMTEDRAKRTSILMSLGKSETSIAADEIQHIMKSPLSTEREEALKSLFTHPKPALLKDIMQEASEKHSYHRTTAIFALGAYPDEEVEKLLLDFLDDPSPIIRSTAAKSLARIGNTTALARVKALAADPALGIMERMNYLIAISFMDKEGKYLADLFEIADHTKGRAFEQTMFSLAAKMLAFKPTLSDLYQEENMANNTGLQQLLEEAKQLKPFFEHTAMLSDYYMHEKYQELWEWCRKLLAERDIKGQFSYLEQAITAYNLDAVDKTNTFAVVYFTYQILQAYFFKEE
jgi:hypothetical protein